MLTFTLTLNVDIFGFDINYFNWKQTNMIILISSFCLAHLCFQCSLESNIFCFPNKKHRTLLRYKELKLIWKCIWLLLCWPFVGYRKIQMLCSLSYSSVNCSILLSSFLSFFLIWWCGENIGGLLSLAHWRKE